MKPIIIKKIPALVVLIHVSILSGCSLLGYRELQGNYRVNYPIKTAITSVFKSPFIPSFIPFPSIQGLGLGGEGCQWQKVDLTVDLKDENLGNYDNKLKYLPYPCTGKLSSYANFNYFSLLLDNNNEFMNALSTLNDTSEIFPTVSVSSLPTNTQTTFPNVVNLSDRGQEKYIKELSDKIKPDPKNPAVDLVKTFQTGLGGNFKPADENKLLDLTIVDRTLFVTVKEPLAMAPADRLIKTIVNIQPPTDSKNSESRGIFVSWDKALTEYATISAGQIQNQTTDSASLSAQISTAKVLPFDGSLTGAVSQQNQHTETFPVNIPIEQLTINLQCYNPKKDKNVICEKGLDMLSISKKSGPGGQPLSGNTQIQVKIKLGDDDCQDFTKKECNIPALSVTDLDPNGCDIKDTVSKTLCENKIKLQEVKLVNHNNEIRGYGLKASLGIDFVVRHVEDGGDTTQEGDDDVRFIQLHTNNETSPILVSKTDIPEYYGISSKNESTESGSVVVVYGNNPSNSSYNIRYVCYPNIKDAIKFMSYANHNLKSNASKELVGGVSFQIINDKNGQASFSRNNAFFLHKGCGPIQPN